MQLACENLGLKLKHSKSMQHGRVGLLGCTSQSPLSLYYVLSGSLALSSPAVSEKVSAPFQWTELM